jgi:hypothetical protein
VSIELNWRIDHDAAILYAVDMMRRGMPLGDGQWTKALAGPGNEMLRLLGAAPLTGEQIRQHLVPLAIRAEGHRHWADTFFRKTIGGQLGELHAPHVAAEMAELTSVTNALWDARHESMATAVETIRGRCLPYLGTLAEAIGNLTEPGLITNRAEVIAVPALSVDADTRPRGGGTAYPLYNALSFELVDPDPDPELPETLRLAWLIAQLNTDLPIYSENLPRDARPLIGALAMLPPTLAAGEELELCRFDPERIGGILRRWDVVGPDAPDLSGTLIDWWSTYRESRPPMSIALGALLKMLG